jgi:hypothetical protein
MPHLESFRKSRMGLHFRIRKDQGYWGGVREVIKAFGSTLKHDQATGEFNVPFTSRSQVALSRIFPEEWEIIQVTDADTITFTSEGE